MGFVDALLWVGWITVRSDGGHVVNQNLSFAYFFSKNGFTKGRRPHMNRTYYGFQRKIHLGTRNLGLPRARAERKWVMAQKMRETPTKALKLPPTRCDACLTLRSVFIVAPE